MGCGQVVRHRFLVAAFVGSNPTTPANKEMNKEVFFSLNNASFSIGKLKLLRDISISVHENDKIALVGKNGVGKSTLLRIINGTRSLDSGDFWLGPSISVGTLNQKNYQTSPLSVLEFLKSQNLEDNEIIESRVEKITNEIKLNKFKIIDELSGGEKRKLALSKLLLLKPDLLLLDEPTNHLDIESIKWLENFLNNEFRGSFLVISHNRDFLKNVTNKVFWMDRGKIKTSSKGFFNFDIWQDSLIEQEKRELRNRKKYLDDEISWLNRGVKARRKRNIKRKDNIYSMKSSYDEEKKEFMKSISKIKISNEATELEDGPNVLINFVNVNKSFKKKDGFINILNDFSFKLMRGEKIGIIGRNGIGKSTFLNLASHKIQPDSGNIKIRKKLNFSFFDQTGEQFEDKKTIKKNLIPSGGDYIDVGNKKMHICGYLKNFLFEPKDVDRNLISLSGGERNRLLLAKILAKPNEILILDEPTNDLDIETIDLLIDFLNMHKGSSLISSHDIDFLEKTCHRFFFFDGSGIIKFSNKPEICKVKTVDESIKKDKKEKPISSEKLINKILKKIQNKENQITDLTSELEKTNFSSKQESNYNYLVNELKKAQFELNTLEKEWIDIEERMIRDD